MSHSREEIIEACREASHDWNVFYKARVVNYRGNTNGDRQKPITEVVAEWLLQGRLAGFKSGISRTTRNNSYKREGNSEVLNENSNNEAYKIALKMKQRGMVLSSLGKAVGFRVPLKDRGTDEAGIIDLVIYNQDRKIAYITEVESYKSKDTVLKCALKVFTHLKTLDEAKFKSDFGLCPDVALKPLILADKDGLQNSMREDWSNLRGLLRELGVELLYYTEEDGRYIILEH